MLTAAPSTAADAARLERNLRALAARSPAAADRIRAAIPHPGVEFVETDEGAWSVLLDARPLASRRRPLEEASRLAEAFDPAEAGVAIILGFGAGHHVGAVVERVRREGVVIVFEPDVSLLRAVLERVDIAPWLEQAPVLFITDPEDAPGLSAGMDGLEASFALGVKFIEHPPSRRRLADASARFADTIGAIVSAARTTLVTTLVQSEATIRNLLGNVASYARIDAGIDDLAGVCVGQPAVVVSAGPSLRRNAHLLARPGLRDRCVIIAVQTTLRPLLAMGVRPHFVVALDYHEISRRFYEHLTPEDVEGVTLVVEPKVSPAVLRAFPGAIRCVGDAMLERLLGPSLAPGHAPLKQGATVAHLAHAFARFLGADPAILIGQDLGFTDGQYYAKGAAIHDVWACELGPFNTLEQMEWQRIARMKRTLRKATDVLGRPIYTDEQMHTYLAQFEREFMSEEAAGLRVIDATEGGVVKRHTTPMSLEQALEAHAPEGAPPLTLPDRPVGALDSRRKDRLDKRLRDVRADAGRVAMLARRTLATLEQMLEKQDDRRVMRRLIGEAEKLGKEVTAIEPAFPIVQRLNQTGAFKRMRADRSIRIEQDLPPLERQRRQVERDADNARWTAEAADMLGAMLDDAVRTLHEDAGASARSGRGRAQRSGRSGPLGSGTRTRQTRRVCALIGVSSEQIAAQRALMEDGPAPLARTLERLAACETIRRVVIVTDDAEGAQELAGSGHEGLEIDFERIEGHPLGARRRAVEGARAFSPDSWRGSLAGLTHFDEVIDPGIAAQALRARALDAALLVPAGAIALDAGLCDRIVERHLERAEEHRVAFSQAPPGVAGVCAEVSMLEELAAPAEAEQVVCTFGQLLGYVPVKPQGDPIAHPSCVQIEAGLRDLGVRVDGAHESGRSMAARLLEAPDSARRGPLWRDGSTHESWSNRPRHLLIECTAPEATGGLRDAWFDLDVPPARAPIDPALLERALRELGEDARRATVTLLGPGAGAGEAAAHPEWRRLIATARGAGVAAVHMRTDLLIDEGTASDLLESGIDVLSVDLYAHSAANYERVTGRDAYRTAIERLDFLLGRRRFAGGLPRMWIVPRITRCDAVQEEIEVFHDKWTLLAGVSVIDQAARAAPGDRIEPLGKPALTRWRDALTRMRICSDGRVLADERDVRAERSAGDLREQSIVEAWEAVRSRRLAALRSEDPEHPDAWTGW